MSNRLIRLLKDKSGGGALEYGLIAAGLLGAIVVVLLQLGPKIAAAFTAG
jgi:Flp pilus assembly pilin Flp